MHHLFFLVGGHLHPSVIFSFGCIYFGIREHYAVSLHHTTDMVSMEMGQIDILDIGRRYTQGFQSSQQTAVPGSHSRIEQNPDTSGLHQKRAYRRRYSVLESQTVNQLV